MSKYARHTIHVKIVLTPQPEQYQPLPAYQYTTIILGSNEDQGINRLLDASKTIFLVVL
jgi:hypothetical protein